MTRCIHCIHCGNAIYNGSSGYAFGVGGAYNTYCVNCRDEFLYSIRSWIEDQYGFEDGNNDMVYLYDERSKAYYDLDEFIEAEADRLADAFLNTVDLFDEADDWPAWGYPEQIPALS